MTQEQVLKMLREYHVNAGRCEYIEAEIRRLRQAAERLEPAFERDVTALPACRPDGMPRGGAPGRPTERIAAALADGEAFRQSEYGREARRIAEQIEALKRELEEKRLIVQYVDSWLKALTERERCVIERHLIEHEIWYDIAGTFKSRFSDEITTGRLKRLQQQALRKIYAIAG